MKNPHILACLILATIPATAAFADPAATPAEAPKKETPAKIETPKDKPVKVTPAVNPDRFKAPDDVAKPPADAVKSASGLVSKVLSPGTGAIHPRATDTVEVHYTGWTTDGKMFDSSLKRGQSISFPLSNVIAGWTEGLQLMVEGEKRRLWIPEKLAYQGRPDRPAGMLVFDVELIKVVK